MCAPGLFSRPGFAELDAVPDIVQGLMHWQSLGKSSPLYLANGHLAFRIDECPDDMLARDWSPAEEHGSDVFFSLESTLTVTKIIHNPIANVGKKVHPRTLPPLGSSGPARRPGTSTASSA
eukprot:12034800-Heterocapsa_arctica.AAC.1